MACCVFLFLAVGTFAGEQAARAERVLIKSAWGSDDPTKASFAFKHASAPTLKLGRQGP
jgi:hypothetical protein